MGFMDKAKKMAEQAQTKLDEVQKGFNEGQGSQDSSQGPDGAGGHNPVRQARPPGAARGRRAPGALGSARARRCSRTATRWPRARLRPPRRRPHRPRPPPRRLPPRRRPRPTARTSTRRRRSRPGTPWRARHVGLAVLRKAQVAGRHAAGVQRMQRRERERDAAQTCIPLFARPRLELQPLAVCERREQRDARVRTRTPAAGTV